METVEFYYLTVVLCVLASSFSQILLKKSANSKHKNFISSLLNIRVVFAYMILFLSLLANVTAMSHGVKLKDLPILESLGYIFVPIFSLLFLKEEMNRWRLLSMILIFVGIVIFYL